jgi:hypothetical protein
MTIDKVSRLKGMLKLLDALLHIAKGLLSAMDEQNYNAIVQPLERSRTAIQNNLPIVDRDGILKKGS